MCKGKMMKQHLAMLSEQDWKDCCVFIFDIDQPREVMREEILSWIRKEADGCTGDDDEDGTSRAGVSYFLIEAGDSRAQGPVFFLLLAGCDDEIGYAVKRWNKGHRGQCHWISFASFRPHQSRQRRTLVIFLRGLLRAGALGVHHKLHKEHRRVKTEL